jgi:16S rRNA G966 N2-methylase RsmD
MHKMVKHIDYALVASAHTAMYLMHKYWARKPHNVVAKYIKNYSQEDEIVLDPFCGSGVTPIEAIRHHRKAIGIDLNPMATFITRQTAIPADTEVIRTTFSEIQAACKTQIEALYETKCKRCGAKAQILITIWDRDKKRPTEIRYFCPVCKKRMAKKLSKEDRSLLENIEGKTIPFWYPKDKIPPGDVFDQGRREAGEYFSDLFTKRNLIALSILYNEITEIKGTKMRDVFKFAFTSMVHLASKMTPVRPSRPYSSFWAMPSYWVPPTYMESNVWMLFDSAVNGKQGLIDGKTNSNAKISYYQEARTFDELKKKPNILIKAFNALELSKIIPPDSVDYVFTDPPYGGSIPYFELSTLWLLWLQGSNKGKRFALKFHEEITINHHHGKDFEYYHKMLTAAFREIRKVLKPGRWLTVTFHSTDIKVWNSIIKAVVLAGFDLEKIIYQPPPRTSSAGLLRPDGSAVGDFYIRFKKPKRKKPHVSPSELDEQYYERVVVETAKKLIAERGEPTAYQYLLNGIIPELDKNGVLLKGTKDIRDVMREHLDKEFVLKDVIGEDGKKKGEKWWLKDTTGIKIKLVPLHERVERAVINVLNREITVSFDDILQEIFMDFPNALTPDTQNIKSVLKEYAAKAGKGRWQLKPRVAEREREHSKMIFFLAQIGEKMGYKIWIGSKEQGDTYKGRKLSEYSEKELELADSLPKEQLDRIKEIDVLWLSEGVIMAEFEVENTTTVTESIVRGANIPSKYKPHRFIVIPEERENLISRKIQEPGLQELGINDWHFIFYRGLEDFYLASRRKKDINLGDLLDLVKEPKHKNPRQVSLDFSSE